VALISEMSGVVLAGGESKRMGRDKAWLAYDGKPLIVHQLDRLSRVFSDVRISAKGSEAFSSLPYPVIEDGNGVPAPILGIAASLRALRRPVFVLAVDLPEFPQVLVEHVARRLLAGESPCLVLRAEGKIHGLCAAYRPSVLEAFERNAARGKLSIYDLVSECGGSIEEEDAWGRFAGPEAFANWNRPEDVEESAPGGNDR
jgi:molybdopterin-guanine dinucleotide biosynthesis protein A